VTHKKKVRTAIKIAIEIDIEYSTVRLQCRHFTGIVSHLPSFKFHLWWVAE
jgi:hypothetical protein